jgi:hypothetical protein
VVSPTYAGIGDNLLSQWLNTMGGIKKGPDNQFYGDFFRIADRSGVGVSFIMIEMVILSTSEQSFICHHSFCDVPTEQLVSRFII